MNVCKHTNLKYFKETDKVVCMDCGEDFFKTVNTQAPPSIPYFPPTDFPDVPMYPVISWNKVE